MNYPKPLVDATVLRRYKRFLADIALPDGTVVTAHCPNPGRMTSAMADGAPCRVGHSDDPKRKLAWTLEQVCVGGVWVGVHPGRANDVVAEALIAGRVEGWAGRPFRREVALGEGTRVDFAFDGPWWVEVKQVSLHLGGGRGAFPDAVSDRATRHAEVLAERVRAGEQASILFLVPRSDVDVVVPADDVDPAYARALRLAIATGVNVRAFRCDVGPMSLILGVELPFIIKPGG